MSKIIFSQINVKGHGTGKILDFNYQDSELKQEKAQCQLELVTEKLEQN